MDAARPPGQPTSFSANNFSFKKISVSVFQIRKSKFGIIDAVRFPLRYSSIFSGAGTAQLPSRQFLKRCRRTSDKTRTGASARFDNRCCNRGQKDQERPNTANDCGNADKCEKARRTAAINGALHRFIQPVPRCRKTADNQSKCKQKCSSAPPIQDAGAAPYRIADETQQRKNHDRCNGCYRVPEIKLHINTSYNKKTPCEPQTLWSALRLCVWL